MTTAIRRRTLLQLAGVAGAAGLFGLMVDGLLMLGHKLAFGLFGVLARPLPLLLGQQRPQQPDCAGPVLGLTKEFDCRVHASRSSSRRRAESGSPFRAMMTAAS